MKKLFRFRYLLMFIVAIPVVFTVTGISSGHYATPILMYHHIDGRAAEWKLSVAPEQFEKQMKFLKEHNYQVMSLKTYIGKIKSGEKVRHKTVVLTFDDGYDNNYTEAYPVLKKYGFPATIFIQVDGIGRDGYMTEDQIRELIENGIEIGSHTMHHGFLPNLSHEQKALEIYDSKNELEARFGIPIDVFSYPGGGFDAESREMVIDAGYIGATATHPGWDYPNLDPYALKRIRVSRTADNPIVFWLQLTGLYTFYEELRG